MPVVQVWDENAENISNVSRITQPDYQYKNKDIFIIICVYSDKVCELIEEQLRKNGFTNIYWNNSQELTALFCDAKKQTSRQCNRCVLASGGCDEYIKRLKGNKETYLGIDVLNCAVTQKCTLNCANCVQMTVEYKEKNIKYECEYEVFKNVWKKVEEVLGWLKYVMLTGGELFLHKDWKKIVNVCLKSEFVGMVGITTNGIYKLKEEDFCFLANEKIIVLLDDYSTKLNENQRALFQMTIDAFKKYRGNYMVLDNTEGTWYRYGEFEKNGLLQDDLKKMYHECARNQCFVLMPEYTFSICGRASTGKFLGYVDTMSTDCVDMLSCDDIEMIRDNIVKLCEKDYLEVCQYCLGSRHIVPAGEQRQL